MRYALTCIGALALLITAGCGQNKELRDAAGKAKQGKSQEAIEAYTGIIMHQKNEKVLNEARVALAGIYRQQKSFEQALKQLEEITGERKGDPAVRELLQSVTLENTLVEGIKSATVQLRQQQVKELEVKHLPLDFTTPIFNGPAESLFARAGVPLPKLGSLAGFTVEVKLKDDPLEPTKIKINYPDQSVKELVLNY
jgi:hypothetical protein